MVAVLSQNKIFFSFNCCGDVLKPVLQHTKKEGKERRAVLRTLWRCPGCITQFVIQSKQNPQTSRGTRNWQLEKLPGGQQQEGMICAVSSCWWYLCRKLLTQGKLLSLAQPRLWSERSLKAWLAELFRREASRLFRGICFENNHQELTKPALLEKERKNSIENERKNSI